MLFRSPSLSSKGEDERVANPQLNFLEQLVVERLAVDELDEKYDPLVASSLDLLPDDKRVLDDAKLGRRSSRRKRVDDFVDLARTEPNTRSCAGRGGISRRLARGEEKDARLRTPSERPSMSKPPPFPPWLGVMMQKSPCVHAAGNLSK